jgi:hypothetical protein
MQTNQRLAAWRSNRTEESPLVPRANSITSAAGCPCCCVPSCVQLNGLTACTRLCTFQGGGPPTLLGIPRWTARRDLLSQLCSDGCALWPRNPTAGAPTLHPPFPQVWCRSVSRPIALHAVAQPDGSLPMHECRPLSPPGCFRIRLRIPPSLSWLCTWRNIGACRSSGRRNTRLVARISSVDA